MGIIMISRSSIKQGKTATILNIKKQFERYKQCSNCNKCCNMLY
jgi:BioD-like phosphotransacetylase family protein